MLVTKRANRLTRYLRDLAFRGDNHATFALALHSAKRIPLPDILRRTNVSVDDFAISRPSVLAPDVEQALNLNVRLDRLPPWLAVYLLSFKVRTPSHASGPALKVALDASMDDQAPLLVIAMIHLARFSLFAPMQTVIEAFLSVPSSPIQGVHFNHLLGAMTSIHSPQSRLFALQLLEAMEARQIRLWARTCTALLSDRHATLKLASYLQKRGERLGEAPTASQLQIYLRISAAKRSLVDSRRYFKAIRMGMPAADHLSPVKRDIRAHRINKAQTELVRSQPDFQSAFKYLHEVVIEAASREKPFGRIPFNHPRHLLGKRAVDILDWNAAFSVGVTDPKISQRRLVRIFNKLRPPYAEFLATAATHKLLLRGLLLRKEWQLAYDHWLLFLRTGQPLSEGLFAAGLRATTLSGRAHETIALLELYARREAVPLRSYIKPTASLVNLIMSCLVEILRPDLVFCLWDTMEQLYQVRPSAGTLRIMLRAAQLPHLLDDSFSGQLALLASKNPFRSRPTGQLTRAELLLSLGTQSAEPYRSGIWKGRPATETASQMFFEVGLGGDIGMKDIIDLEPPAVAVRPHAESGRITYSTPVTQLVSMLTTTTMPLLVHPPPLAPPTAEQRKMQEHIWTEYILLLGMTRRAPEISRVLGWMRALDVEPRRRTIGIALAFWAEVSVHAPFVAALAGKAADEYARLVGWLEDWLGERGVVPDEPEIRMWHAKIEKVRRRRREMVEKGRYDIEEEEKIWQV
ncbi:hypothetical protein C8F01DRAFT_1149092 [Mycena amicta]|nr:hypothetical protein C8F01DRAFT_1149092 [Mycena amicta]